MQHVTFVMTWSYMRNGRGRRKDLATADGPATVQSEKNNHKNPNFKDKPDICMMKREILWDLVEGMLFSSPGGKGEHISA